MVSIPLQHEFQSYIYYVMILTFFPLSIKQNSTLSEVCWIMSVSTALCYFHFMMYWNVVSSTSCSDINVLQRSFYSLLNISNMSGYDDPHGLSIFIKCSFGAFIHNASLLVSFLDQLPILLQLLVLLICYLIFWILSNLDISKYILCFISYP